MTPPFPQSYWLEPGLLSGGHYPADLDPHLMQSKLQALVSAGFRHILNLTLATEHGRNGLPFLDYRPDLQHHAADREHPVECHRLGWPDGGIPPVALMQDIQARLAHWVRLGEPVYFHCWGGHGRTGTVAACRLIEQGLTPDTAIARILELRKPLPKNWYPFEGRQEAFIRAWTPSIRR